MRNKKGVGNVGFLPVWLVLTIMLIILLILFAFFSSFAQKFDDSKAHGTLEEGMLGLAKVSSYAKINFPLIAEMKFIDFSTSKSIEQIFSEVKGRHKENLFLEDENEK